MSESGLSHEVSEFCRQVLSRWRELALIRSCGNVLIAGCLLTAGLLIADALLDLPSWLRIVGLATLVLSLTGLVTSALLRAWRPMSLTQVAAIIEATDPAWQERLLAVVDEAPVLASDSPTVRICRRQVQRELAPLIASHTPHDVLDGRRALTRFALGIVALLGLIAPWFWSPAGMQLLWQRLLQPQRALAWGWSYRLDAVEPIQVAVQGTDVPVRVTAAPLFFASTQPPELWLNWIHTGDTTASERRLIWSDADRAYVGHVTQPAATFGWNLVCRGGRSAPHRTQVVPAPVLREFLLTADPPSYTGLAARRFQNPVEPVVVPQGTRLNWRMTWSEPLKGLELHFQVAKNDVAPDVVARTSGLLKPDGVTGSAAWNAEQTVQVVAVVTTGLGLVVEVPLGEVTVTPDQPPQFRLHDRLSRSVSVNETVTVAAAVLDDHGLKSLELHVEPAVGDKQVRNIPLDRMSPTRFDGQSSVDLATLGLEAGQMVQARWRATDNAPTAHVAWSDPMVLVIRHGSPDDELHKLAREADESREELRKIRNELTEIRKQLREVHRRTAAATVKQKSPKTEAELEQLTQRESLLRQRLEEWAKDREQNDWLSKSAQAVREIADGDLKEAQELLEAAGESEPRPQIEELSRSLDELAAADRQLDRLDAELAQLGQKGTPLLELAQLADRAEDLARELELAPENADLNPQAEQLAEDLDNWLEQHPDFAAAVNAAQMDELRRIGQMAGQLAENEQQIATAIDPEFAEAVSADQPANGSQANESHPVDAEQPRNQPQPGGEQFQAGQQVADRLREAADQSTELARDLLERFGPDAPPVEAAIAAAEAANEAQQQLEQGQPAAAAQSSQQAATQAQQAGQALKGSEAGQQAEQLSQSLQAAAEQLQSQADSAEFQRGGMASAQENLAETVIQLEQLTQLTTQLDGGQTPSEPRTLGEQMSQAFRQAEEALTASRDALADANTGSAQSAALAAQSALEGAARLVPPAPKPSGVPTSTGDSLQQARQNLKQAQRALKQPEEKSEATTACTSCRNAGNALRRAAQGESRPGSSPAVAGGTRQQPGGSSPLQAGLPQASSREALNSELARQSQRVWGRLPGKLRTEIFQGSQQSVHPEYARQIQRYFERIAQSPSEGAPQQTTPSP